AASAGPPLMFGGPALANESGDGWKTLLRELVPPYGSASSKTCGELTASEQSSTIRAVGVPALAGRSVSKLKLQTGGRLKPELQQNWESNAASQAYRYRQFAFDCFAPASRPAA